MFDEVTFRDIIAAQQAAQWDPPARKRRCVDCGALTTAAFRCSACVCKDDPFAIFGYPPRDSQKTEG